MARADSTSTTRRTFVRLASAAVVASVASTPALSEDAELIQLSARLAEATAALEAAAERGDEKEIQALYREGSAIFDEIWEFAATTIPGAQAKCRALFWVHGDTSDGWDCKYSFDLVADLLAIGQPAGA
jgi:hypothetical protein